MSFVVKHTVNHQTLQQINTMLKKNSHVHLIGIGGIGMSGIAKILKYRGHEVSGCDLNVNQQSIKDLQRLDCTIFFGNNTTRCKKNIDALVYSSAITTTSPEITDAKNNGVPVIHRAQMLAELMESSHGIAITGAHGKTTTTALISDLLLDAQFDPTIVTGGYLNSIASNAHSGTGKFFIAEADESDKSFLFLRPLFAIITNIDLDHVETYTSLVDIKNTFKSFLNNIATDGKIIACIDDKNSAFIFNNQPQNVISYGLHPTADVRATEVCLNQNNSTFILHIHNECLGLITINMPGIHNVQNSLAAIALAHQIHVPLDSIKQTLKQFKGIDRRFSYRGTYLGAQLFDDYGHHPEEIKYVLKVAQLKAKNIIIVFQPHRYTRTKALWSEFVTVFAQSSLKHLIVTDIYSAGEKAEPTIDAKSLIAAIRQKNPSLDLNYSPLSTDLTELKEILNKITNTDDLIIFLGAGSIGNISAHLITEIT